MNDVLVMAIIFGAFSIFNYVLRSYYSDIEQEAIKNIEAAIEQSQIKVNTQSKDLFESTIWPIKISSPIVNIEAVSILALVY